MSKLQDLIQASNGLYCARHNLELATTQLNAAEKCLDQVRKDFDFTPYITDNYADWLPQPNDVLFLVLVNHHPHMPVLSTTFKIPSTSLYMHFIQVPRCDNANG